MVDIKKILQENGEIIKFAGLAPDGFHLIHEKTLSDLKAKSTWEQWIDGKISLEELNKKNFDSEQKNLSLIDSST